VTEETAPKRRPVVERYGPWVALYAAIALTASGEFELAVLVGFPSWIAWALPTACDVYVMQAMRRRHDVTLALLLAVGANAVYHLAATGLFGVTAAGRPTWWLVVLVSAIAPLIVWRVHRITEDRIPLSANETDNAPADTAVDPAPAADNSPVPVAPAVASEAPPIVAPPTPVVADSTPAPAANTTRQESTPAAPAAPGPVAKKPAKKTPKATHRRPGGKAPRRSMDEWVDLAGPIFHTEFMRLRRQPTASEFATAIEAAGHGRVSDSTAKNIRTEILDRTDVPALDQAD
jgi:hypothetical protein